MLSRNRKSAAKEVSPSGPSAQSGVRRMVLVGGGIRAERTSSGHRI